MASIKASRGGQFTTSYTAMQRGHAHDDAPREADQSGEVAPELTRDPDDLPGGAASGIFLHAIIENLDFATLTQAPDAPSWAALPPVAALLEKLARTHNIEARHLPHAARMVHASLTARVPLGPHGELRGLFRPARRLCEVEFLFPLPRRAPAGPLDEEGRVRQDEGYVKGYIDYLFEHEGRLYFADWKSDGLRSWGRSFLEAHVHNSYPRQLQLYSLALVRMLGVTDEAAFEEKFGGIVYVFLRGTGLGDGEGLTFWRPSWGQILEWEADLTRYSP